MRGNDTTPGAGDGARVREAMAAVPRALFLPEDVRHLAGADAALPIGGVGHSTCSQPSTVRAMLELLDVHPGHHVLDVGSGSGWSTALVAWLASPGGSVIGVELDAGLVDRARVSVEALRRGAGAGAGAGPREGTGAGTGGSLNSRDVSLRFEVARLDRVGWPDAAPFDRILVNADASGRMPPGLVDQLADQGVVVGPVDGVMTRLVRRGTRTRATAHGEYVFMPLQES